MDHDTEILIRAITKKNPKSILDIGCGWGPLGIILAKNNSQAEVAMTDRDLLAVRYANYNIKKSKILNAIAIGGLGMEAVKGKTFDLIVNIPAKIGNEAIIKEFIIDPYQHLYPYGEYWFVVVSGLNWLIPYIGPKHNINIEYVRKRRGHTVYKIKKAVL